MHRYKLSGQAASSFFNSASFYVVCFTLVWWACRWAGDGNLDGYADMLENYAWGRYYELGTYKHPPFFSWVVKFWFSIFPVGDAAYKLLAYVNVAIGLVGVFQLAKIFNYKNFALPSVVLLTWAFPYTTLAGKFNANSILLSLWPWVVVAWYSSLNGLAWRKFLWAFVLGILSAFAILSKYYSAVLLLALGIATVLLPQGRKWLSSYGHLLAWMGLLLTLLPHLRWLYVNDWVTLGYVSDQGGGHVDIKNLLKFILAPIFYWFIPWIVCCVWFCKVKPNHVGLRKAMWMSWSPNGFNDALFWVAMGPWLITLVFGITGFVELSLPWAIPIGFAFPLLWLRNLSGETQMQDDAVSLSSMIRWRIRAFVAIPVLTIIVTAANAVNGNKNYYLPRAEAAELILGQWAAAHPDIPLKWVGGDWAENALIAFYGNHEVATFPGLPDGQLAEFFRVADWRQQGGVVFCTLGPSATDQDFYAWLVEQQKSSNCVQAALEWSALNGNTYQPLVVSASKSGWLYPNPIKHVYWAMPYLAQ